MKKITFILFAVLLVAAGCSHQAAKNSPPPGSPPNNPGLGVSVQTTTAHLVGAKGSKEAGTASLTEVGGKVTVIFTLANAPAGVRQPAAIYRGTCAKLSDKAYDLASPLNGKSSSQIDASFKQVMALVPLVVVVFKSPAQPAVQSACGNISNG